MMSTPVKVAGELIDLLCNRFYQPDEDAPEFCRSDLAFEGKGTVRVVIADDVTVIAFDQHMVERWSARYEGATPLAVIEAAIVAAEDDTTDRCVARVQGEADPCGMRIVQRDGRWVHEYAAVDTWHEARK